MGRHRLFDRASGILLHITSLPGPWGIGDLGPSAYTFIDWLALTGQSYWQILPVGPTGYGDSPYQLLSLFGGNPLLISIATSRNLEPATGRAGTIASWRATEVAPSPRPGRRSNVMGESSREGGQTVAPEAAQPIFATCEVPLTGTGISETRRPLSIARRRGNAAKHL